MITPSLTPVTDELDRDRGQAGLGTLIVFLSMIIIAAMAAGVLINAGTLVESHAAAAGEESTEQVADRVTVLNDVGYTGAAADGFDRTHLESVADGDVHRLELTVQPGPGTDAISFEEATIEFLGEEVATLTHVSIDDYDGADFDGDAVALADADGEFFTVRELEGGASADVLGRDDRGVIVIPLGTYDDRSDWVASDAVLEQPGRLEEGETAELTLTTAQGSQTLVRVTVPEPLHDEPAVDL